MKLFFCRPGSRLATVLTIVLIAAACNPAPDEVTEGFEPLVAVPDWAADAIFYQIFPERFANGDTSNDPTWESLEYRESVPRSWQISPWTGDWYARSDWEQESGPDFYEDGVFHRRYGGDLQGVIDHLPYLESLGINTIYFNPVFYARSLHKYDGNTFHHIDPYFGPDPEGDLALLAEEDALSDEWVWTSADRLFLELLGQAHANGIRVIIDGVWNHTGRDFFAFQDLVENQADSRYRDWYIVESFDDPETDENEFVYKGWWGVETLPEFADTADGTDLHADPKAYVFRATARWMDPNGDGDPSDGINGWRLDVTEEVPRQFWIDWNTHVRALNPNAYTVSEIWNEASEHVRHGGFSATMNYHAFAVPIKGFLIDNQMSADEFERMLTERASLYSDRVQYALQNLVESHDTDRLASMIVNARDTYTDRTWFDYDRGGVSPRGGGDYDIRKPNESERAIQRLVALFQMTYAGPPMIYYGTEAGMWGADDPDDRMPMTWPEMEFDDQRADPRDEPRTPDPVGFNERLFGFYQAAIHLRNQSTALRRGSIRFLDTEPENTVAFLREDNSEAMLVVVNRSDE
jgi:glycosidase